MKLTPEMKLESAVGGHDRTSARVVLWAENGGLGRGCTLSTVAKHVMKHGFKWLGPERQMGHWPGAPWKREEIRVGNFGKKSQLLLINTLLDAGCEVPVALIPKARRAAIPRCQTCGQLMPKDKR